MPRTEKDRVTPPNPFHIDRTVPPGRHRLLEVFRRLDKVPPFRKYPATAEERRQVVRGTSVEIVPGTVWMYVAPHEVPPFAKEVGWNPVTSDTDCIVVGRRHLSRSRSLTLYLDILHELYHVFQRRSGRDLWNISDGYAGSLTELEAYGFAVGEAKRLGVTNRYLQEYLKVEWIDAKEHARLMRNLGIPAHTSR